LWSFWEVFRSYKKGSKAERIIKYNAFIAYQNKQGSDEILLALLNSDKVKYTYKTQMSLSL
jgi:imidazole glycerol phosphate synthase subunit HisF